MTASFALESSPFDPKSHPDYVQQQRDIWVKISPQEFVPDDWLGYKPHPNTQVRHIMRTRQDIVWDVILSFDQYGHRVTKQSQVERRKHFLVTHGCSFVMGTGVQDDETLAFYLAQQLPDYHIYNTAIGASGTHMMLAKIQDPRLREALGEQSGIFVYIPISGHVDRANFFFEESRAMGNTPLFEKNQAGDWRKIGSGREIFSTRYFLFKQFRNLRDRFFPERRFILPPRLPQHIHYACNLTIQAAKDFEKSYPNSKFIVVPHPSETNLDERYLSCIEQAGLNVVQVAMTPKWGHQIAMDGHPNAEFNRQFSVRLAIALKPYLSGAWNSNPM